MVSRRVLIAPSNRPVQLKDISSYILLEIKLGTVRDKFISSIRKTPLGYYLMEYKDESGLLSPDFLELADQFTFGLGR